MHATYSYEIVPDKHNIGCLYELGTAICLYNFLNICMHKLQWTTVRFFF